MIYKLLKNLFWKEIKIFKGTFPSLTSDYRVLFGFLFLLILGMLGLIATFYSLFMVYFRDISALEGEEASRFVLNLIVLWLTLIIFFSSVQDSRSKFFSEEFNFLLSTPIMPWLLFFLRLLKSSYLSMNNNFLLLFFGAGPLIGFGLLLSTPWYSLLAVVLIAYVYLLIPVALGLLFVTMVVRFLRVSVIVKLAAFINFILIVLWLLFLSVGQEAILSRLISKVIDLQSSLDWIFFISMTSEIINNLILGIPLDPYRLSLPFFPMIIFTLLLTTVLTKRAYQLSYERVRLSAKQRALPTVKASWGWLFRRKISPFRRFVLLVLTQYKLVLRSHITALWSGLYFGVIFLFLLALTALGIKASDNLFLSLSLMVIIVFTNSGSRVFFQPANNFGYHKLSPLRNSFLIWNLLFSRFILQFGVGTVFLILFGLVIDIDLWKFLNLFVLLVILLASVESFSFYLNIMKYNKLPTLAGYYGYFVIITLILVFLSPFDFVISTWGLILLGFMVSVLSFYLAERQWDRMEVR